MKIKAILKGSGLTLTVSTEKQADCNNEPKKCVYDVFGYPFASAFEYKGEVYDFTVVKEGKNTSLHVGGLEINVEQ